MARHVDNTRKLVDFLLKHPAVESVTWPELESHPDHALAQTLLPRGCGGVFSFELRGGRAAGKRFVDGLKLFSHMANAGDARSLAIHPASTTHARVSAGQLASAGVADDLIEDLTRGLKLAQKGA
jgi:O-acetylhomoserine (thiol)-lyase